jgi:hypothetical protein
MSLKPIGDPRLAGYQKESDIWRYHHKTVFLLLGLRLRLNPWRCLRWLTAPKSEDN